MLSYSSRNLKNEKTPLSEWKKDSKEYENLTILNLTYDVTPPDLISCVVTDMGKHLMYICIYIYKKCLIKSNTKGMLPCTSVPVVLRLKNRDNLN